MTVHLYIHSHSQKNPFSVNSAIWNKEVGASLPCYPVFSHTGLSQVHLSSHGAEVKVLRSFSLAPGEGEAQLYWSKQSEGKDYSF